MNQYGPHQPMYPGYRPGPAPAERRAKAVALTVSAIAAVAAVTAATVVWVGGEDPAPAAPGAVSPDVAPPAGTPAAAGYDYLRALADGDAEAALKAGAIAPGSAQYTTPDVLRMQLNQLPVTAISAVESPAPGDTDTRKTVTLSARFGDHSSSTAIQLVKPQGSTQWQLPRAAITVAPLLPSWQNRIIDVLTVAGIPTLEDASTSVFPGAAPVFSASRYLDVTAAPLLLEALGGGDGTATWSPHAALNDRGRAATEDQIAQRLRFCLQPRQGNVGSTLTCPPPPDGVDLATVRTFDGFTEAPELTYGELDQTKLEIAVTGTVRYALTVDSGTGPRSVPVTAAVDTELNFAGPTEPSLDFR